MELGGAMDKVNIDHKLSEIGEHWNPRIVGELNGQHVKLAKLKGEFVWHHHDDEDELFLVVRVLCSYGCPRRRSCLTRVSS